MASKADGAASWCCCGETFKEHAAVHKHVAKTHDCEIKQLTQATFKHLSRQLEEEPAAQRVVQPVDISAWMPDISHISKEELQR